MLPEEWPIAALAGDQNAPARSAGGDRLATVRADFFLDPAYRLTEQERALMMAMLNRLIGTIADEIRVEAPMGRCASNDGSNAALVDELTAAKLLDEPQLIALLLRRAAEERIGAGAKARAGHREARALQGLVSHENGAVSAAAMALILARGRRRDRFGQCLIAFDDLSAGTAELLVHTTAAAIRRVLGSQGGAAADLGLAAASERLLARRNPELAIDGLTERLVRLLDESGSLNDELLIAAANDGKIAFVALALARRGGIAGEVAIEELLSGDPARAMMLLRAAGVSRQFSAGLLAGSGDLLGIGDAGAAIDRFDEISDDEADSARARLATPFAYRAALSALDKARGQRSL
jgi:hypothetical protein